jgi:hypothetical protein
MMEDVYRPGGKVSWGRLLLAALFALPILVLLSDLAFRLDKARWYPPYLGAILLGALAAVMGVMVVEWGKCRNRAVGRAVVVGAVLVFYVGFFERSFIDLQASGSPEGLRRVPVVDLITGLPNYIAFRMRNFELAPGLENPKETHRLVSALNWIIFALELGTLVSLGWVLGGVVARRPFSERNNSWMTSERFAVPEGTALAIGRWLEGVSSLSSSKDGEPVEIVVLEHAPKDSGEDGYLTLIVGHNRARRSVMRRRRVPAHQLAELRRFLA